LILFKSTPRLTLMAAPSTLFETRPVDP
jgi:hypothetical protein